MNMFTEDLPPLPPLPSLLPLPESLPWKPLLLFCVCVDMTDKTRLLVVDVDSIVIYRQKKQTHKAGLTTLRTD